MFEIVRRFSRDPYDSTSIYLGRYLGTSFSGTAVAGRRWHNNLGRPETIIGPAIC